MIDADDDDADANDVIGSCVANADFVRDRYRRDV